MQKEVVWVAVIAIGVFIGIMAYDKYVEIRTQAELQALMENIQKSSEKSMQAFSKAAKQSQLQSQARLAELNRQKAAREEQKRLVEFDKSTACGINEDRDTCSCINIKTGAKVRVPKQDCEKRAREITW